MTAAQKTDIQESQARDRKRGGVPLHVLNAVMVVIAAVIAALFLWGVHVTHTAYTELEEASQNYIECESAVSDMKAGSNYLTIQVRTFVVTQDLDYLHNYFWEADENRRRERAVETLEELQGNETSESLKAALEESVDLMQTEYYAMRLVAEAAGYDAEIADHLADYPLSAEDAALSPEDKIARAQDLVFGDAYMNHVDRIEGNVAQCKDTLLAKIDAVQQESQSTLNNNLVRQRVLAVLLIVAIVAMAVSVLVLVLMPLRTFNARIRENKPLPSTGTAELQELSASYNAMYDETMQSYDVLRQKAEHDPLTGLYNRSVFERLLETHASDHYAIMIVDADYFKSINDTLGHDVGDAALRKIAGQLSKAFRTTDYPCRIGGDEFAVFMTEMTEELRYVVTAKVESIRTGLADTSDGLPALTVSIGIAFSDGVLTGEQVFKRADQALFKVKEAGRNGFGFFEG